MQTTLGLGKENWSFLNRDSPVLIGPPKFIMLTQSHSDVWKCSWQFAIKNAGETNSIKHDWLDERSSMGKRFSPVQRVRDNDITMICSVISDVLAIYVLEVRASINSIKLSLVHTAVDSVALQSDDQVWQSKILVIKPQIL